MRCLDRRDSKEGKKEKPKFNPKIAAPAVLLVFSHRLLFCLRQCFLFSLSLNGRRPREHTIKHIQVAVCLCPSRIQIGSDEEKQELSREVVVCLITSDRMLTRRVVLVCTPYSFATPTDNRQKHQSPCQSHSLCTSGRLPVCVWRGFAVAFVVLLHLRLPLLMPLPLML